MLIDLLNNIAITATLLFIAGKFFQKRALHLKASIKTRIYAGLGSGLLGSLLMISTIEITETVIVDLRHLSMVTAAVFGGPVAVIISGFIIGTMRVLLFGLNPVSIVAGFIAIVMGGVMGLISITGIAKVYKYLIMNSAFVLATSYFIYVFVNNPSISQKTLFYYIPISIVGGIFTYYMAEYIKKSNDDHRSMMYYKMMADNSMDLICTHNSDGTFKYLSPSCKSILGYESYELIGKSPYDFHHQDDLKDIMGANPIVKSTSENYIVQYRFKRRDGSYIWLETASRKMEDPLNESNEIISISRNITERKVIEEALNESNERYLNLVTHMPDPMIVHKDEKIIFANEKACELGKFKIDELIGKSIFEFIHPDYHTAIIEQMKHINELKNEHVTLEFKIKTSTNHILDIEATSKFISFNNENAIQVIYRDVTERKRLERELKKTHERFGFIMDNSKDVISILKSDGIVEYISPACEKLFGYTSEEFHGKNAFEYIHPDDTGEILNLHKQFQYSKMEFVSITYRYKTKSNEYIWVETIAKAVLNGNMLESILLITRDVTSRKEKTLALEESNKALQELSSMDGLTEIPNRRCFNEILSMEWNRHKEETKPLSVILLDIDFFKKYNDEYGHLEGDDCLRKVAKVLQNSLTFPRDFVARYGGEEFVVILPETNEKGAMIVAENLRKNISDSKIPHIKSEIADYVTISLGCATLIPSMDNNTKLLVDRADKALYQSKKTGRNQASLYESENCFFRK